MTRTPTLFKLETPAVPATAGPRPRLARVAGLDISLTGTGIATLGGTARVPTKGRRKDTLVERNARMKHITNTVLEEVGTVDLACVEGPVGYATPGGSTWDRGGLWWRIVAALLERDIPVAVISPTARAKYATGSGASRKAAVLDAARRRYGAILESDDEADALILRAMGLHWLEQPLAEVPDGHRAALSGCQWPDREQVMPR
jgi:Holliday junction resolvasome RuvABC endonuclease subunit